MLKGKLWNALIVHILSSFIMLFKRKQNYILLWTFLMEENFLLIYVGNSALRRNKFAYTQLKWSKPLLTCTEIR